MEDGDRTTQEQLSTHSLGEALNDQKALKQVKKRCCRIAHFCGFGVTLAATCCKSALATALFAGFEHTCNC